MNNHKETEVLSPKEVKALKKGYKQMSRINQRLAEEGAEADAEVFLKAPPQYAECEISDC